MSGIYPKTPASLPASRPPPPNSTVFKLETYDQVWAHTTLNLELGFGFWVLVFGF